MPPRRRPRRRAVRTGSPNANAVAIRSASAAVASTSGATTVMEISCACHQVARQRASEQPFAPTRFGSPDDDLRDVVALGVVEDLGDQDPRRADARGSCLSRRRGAALSPCVSLPCGPAALGSGFRCSANHSDLSACAMRAAERTTVSENASGPTQTSSRSAVGHWPLTPRWRRSSSICSSTRSAARRSASSRNAIRLPGLKNWSMARRALSGIDLALSQPLDEVLGRQIDEHDFVGLFQDFVGHRLPDGDAGDAGDDIGQAFEVLYVQRRPDVDAGAQRLAHVLIALGVQHARCVRVCEFVDQQQLRMPCDRGVDIELHGVSLRDTRPACAPAPRGRRATPPFPSGRASRRRRRRRRHRVPSRRAPPTAWRRSCRHPAPCRETPLSLPRLSFAASSEEGFGRRSPVEAVRSAIGHVSSGGPSECRVKGQIEFEHVDRWFRQSRRAVAWMCVRPRWPGFWRRRRGGRPRRERSATRRTPAKCAGPSRCPTW